VCYTLTERACNQWQNTFREQSYFQFKQEFGLERTRCILHDVKNNFISPTLQESLDTMSLQVIPILEKISNSQLNLLLAMT